MPYKGKLADCLWNKWRLSKPQYAIYWTCDSLDALRKRDPVQLGKAFRRFRVLREVLCDKRLVLSATRVSGVRGVAGESFLSPRETAF